MKIDSNIEEKEKEEGGNMSYADKVFIEMCRDIIDNGTSTEGAKSATKVGRRELCVYDQEVWSSKSL